MCVKQLPFIIHECEEERKLYVLKYICYRDGEIAVV